MLATREPTAADQCLICRREWQQGSEKKVLHYGELREDLCFVHFHHPTVDLQASQRRTISFESAATYTSEYRVGKSSL